MPKIIGLTGGIGSGKTTVARLFGQLGVPVYIADDAGRLVLQQPETILQIRNLFGDAVISDGQVDRAALGAIVFNNGELLKSLNNIVHPRVAAHFGEWIQDQNMAHYVIREAAILFESGSYKDCDRIISVVADIETRISRVIKRDNVDRKAVISRIENQWSDEQRIAHSDFIIVNNDLTDTTRQVADLHAKLQKMQ
jgi:dephospho-CoA kinase